MENNFLLAILFTIIAGFATTIGGCIVLFLKRTPSPSFMSLTLGFSAGVMIIISFQELLHNAINSLGFVPANFAFLVGFGLMFLIDYLVPHEFIGQIDRKENKAYDPKVLKTGLFVAVGIAIHNFPEGMAVFVGTLKDVKFGLAIAVAIGIHNIAEGIAVSVPVFAATKSFKKAFWWSFLSGIAEPIGAVVAGIILYPFLTPVVLGWSFAAVAGIMIYISFDELMPLSRSCGGTEHVPIVGVLLGMITMIFSLWLLRFFNL